MMLGGIGIERWVRRGKCQGQEEGTRPIVVDELDAAIDEFGGQPVKIEIFGDEVDAFAAAVERERDHVVAVWKAVEIVEALDARRPVGRDMAEMPFADQRLRVIWLQPFVSLDLFWPPPPLFFSLDLPLSPPPHHPF